jgi:hypothetical protein
MLGSIIGSDWPGLAYAGGPSCHYPTKTYGSLLLQERQTIDTTHAPVVTFAIISLFSTFSVHLLSPLLGSQKRSTVSKEIWPAYTLTQLVSTPHARLKLPIDLW